LHAELPRNDLVIWTAGNVSARVPGQDLLVSAAYAPNSQNSQNSQNSPLPADLLLRGDWSADPPRIRNPSLPNSSSRGSTREPPG